MLQEIDKLVAQLKEVQKDRRDLSGLCRTSTGGGGGQKADLSTQDEVESKDSCVQRLHENTLATGLAMTAPCLRRFLWVT